MTRKEAINEIKSWAIPSKKGREVLETLIPELCESEDERIRKEIIEFIQWSEDRDMTRHDFHQAKRPSKWIAYLEKQKEPIDPFDTKLFQDGVKEGRRLEREDIKKEQEPVKIDEDIELGLDRALMIVKDAKGVLPGYQTDDGIYECDHAIRTLTHILKNGIEQKPVHTAKEMWKEMRLEVYAQASGNRHEPNYSDDSTKMFSLCDIDEIFEKIGNSTVGSQPAEWSEGDENKLYQVVETLLADKTITLRENPHCKALHRAYDELIDWLKSLPKRFNLQPKQEWSEEDENNLELVIDCIYKFYPDPVMKYKLKEWLKSLRPAKDCSSCAKHLEGYISGRSDAENKLLEQFGALVTPEGELHIKPRWKPSEEQMQYLLAVINDPNNAGAESCHLILESLYNDLKEL